jgi:hypothetical protein
MAFALPLAMVATAIGAGVQAYGAYQGGQAQKAMYNYQAGVGQALGGAEMQAANVTEYAGGRAAESQGLRYGGQIARGAVGYGAGNVAGRTVGDVRASQIALGVEAQRETMGKYAETAYGERVRGAELTAGAGLQTMAAAQAPIAGAIGAAGDIVSGFGKVAGMYAQPGGPSVVGGSQPVSSKWYGTSDEAIY